MVTTSNARSQCFPYGRCKTRTCDPLRVNRITLRPARSRCRLLQRQTLQAFRAQRPPPRRRGSRYEPLCRRTNTTLKASGQLVIGQHLTVGEVADALGVNPAWVLTVAETGLAPAIRLTSRRRSYRIAESDLEIWRGVAETAIIAGNVSTWIYFVQPVWGGPVKIGLTANLRSRLDAMQAMSPLPLRVLAVQPGDRDREIELHQRFAPWRTHGEWFSWDADGLPELIRATQDRFGIPDAKVLMRHPGAAVESSTLTQHRRPA